MSRTRFVLIAIVMPWLMLLGACGTIRTLTVGPSLCKPANDLGVKHLKRVPEVATANDEFYSLYLMERAAHATDITDFNSLYRTCVNPTLPEVIPVFEE